MFLFVMGQCFFVCFGLVSSVRFVNYCVVFLGQWGFGVVFLVIYDCL